MPEVSDNAAFLIATSFQAYQRLNTSDFGEKICVSAVTIVFACIYLEQSLDVIVRTMKVKSKMEREILDGNSRNHQPSLLEKYIWFCNKYLVDDNEKVNEPFGRDDKGNYKYLHKLDENLPGFNTLRYLRNKITHGKIEKIIPYLDQIKNLRKSAKDIVSKILQKVNLENIQDKNWHEIVSRLEQEYKNQN